MKEKPDIDELLNSFIDGELTERHRVEVQRLIKHDPQIAHRMQELQKCKMLVSSLPRADAPVEILARVKASLKARALLVPGPEIRDHQLLTNGREQDICWLVRFWLLLLCLGW